MKPDLNDYDWRNVFQYAGDLPTEDDDLENLKLMGIPQADVTRLEWL